MKKEVVVIRRPGKKLADTKKKDDSVKSHRRLLRQAGVLRYNELHTKEKSRNN